MDPGIFNVFVDWVYLQKLPATDKDWDVVTETKDLANLSIMKARAFSDHFIVPKLLQDASNYYVDTKISVITAPNYNVVIYASTISESI